MTDGSVRDLPRARATAEPDNRWPAVFAVAFCSFSLVLSEFLPIGLLTDIAGGLRVSPGTAGLLVVMPGLAATVATPAATILAGRIDRRTVLVALSALLTVSDLLAAVSPDLGVMLLARVLLGVAVGAFWVFGTGVAPRLVDQARATRATATVTSGIALATVASLPLGALIGHVTSWRFAFALGAALGLVALAAQLTLLPPLPADTRNTLRTLLGVLRTAPARTVLIATVATFVAQFAAYTYLEPYLRDEAGFGPTAVTLTLLAFGAAGLISNFAFTRLIDATPKRAVATFLALAAVAIGTLPWAEHNPATAVSAVVLWGLFWGALPISLQIFMMRTAGATAEAGQATFVTTIQISLAAGSALGGLVVDHAGLNPTFLLAAAVALTGVVVLTLRGRRTTG